MRTPSDSDLLRRAASGDRTAWETLYRRHVRFVHRVAYRFLSHEEDARDIAQDVFVAVFQAAGRWRDEASFRTWLWRTTAHRCLNHQRRARREEARGAPEDVAGQSASAHDPVQSVEQARAAARLRQAFQALPDRGRLAVILVYFEGLSYEEASRAMDCTVSAIESLLVRARDRLRDAIETM